jgi:hypothetical protein
VQHTQFASPLRTSNSASTFTHRHPPNHSPAANPHSAKQPECRSSLTSKVTCILNSPSTTSSNMPRMSTLYCTSVARRGVARVPNAARRNPVPNDARGCGNVSANNPHETAFSASAVLTKRHDTPAAQMQHTDGKPAMLLGCYQAPNSNQFATTRRFLFCVVIFQVCKLQLQLCDNHSSSCRSRISEHKCTLQNCNINACTPSSCMILLKHSARYTKRSLPSRPSPSPQQPTTRERTRVQAPTSMCRKA